MCFFLLFDTTDIGIVFVFFCELHVSFIHVVGRSVGGAVVGPF